MKCMFEVFEIVILPICCVSQKLLLAARRNLGEILSAFEFMDHHCIDLVSTQEPPSPGNKLGLTILMSSVIP